MEPEAQASGTPDRKIALLIDADNVSHAKIAAILAELSKHGTANVRRAYGDWASPGLNGWKDKLHDFAIWPIQQFSYSTGKNATAAAHEDGWAAMSAAGSAAKRQASIDPRNYGVRNFPELFAATGLFEIVRMKNGQGYVADRRNRDRTAKPVR